jgi:hypothetical protein
MTGIYFDFVDLFWVGGFLVIYLDGDLCTLLTRDGYLARSATRLILVVLQADLRILE